MSCNLRVLKLTAVSTIKHEALFSTLEFVKLEGMGGDCFTRILQECPNLRELIYIQPDEPVHMNLEVPDTLQALCIYGKEILVDETVVLSIENMLLVTVLGTLDMWFEGDVLCRTGKYMTKNTGCRDFVLQ